MRAPTTPRARRSRSLGATMALTAALGACALSSTEPELVIDPSDPPVVGMWAWHRSTGGLLPDDRTPATEGYTMSLDLGADGIATIFYDGEASGSTTYDVGVGTTGGAVEGSPAILFGESLFGFAEQALAMPSADSLVLSDGCCDGFQWIFVRDGG